MTNKTATDTAKYFYGWIGMGPTALQYTIFDYGWCSRSWWLLPIDRRSCRDGLKLVPSSTFAPIPGPLVGDLLLRDEAVTGESVKQLIKNSYGLHFNNQNLKGHRFLLEGKSVIAGLLKKACPVTVSLSGDEI